MASEAGRRGSALIATLAATSVLLPLAAFAVLLTRSGFRVHENTRAQAEAFFVAEAGLEHALADIPSTTTTERLLAGPDGRRATSDDGRFRFREGQPTFFPRAPLYYEVQIEPVTSERVRLTSHGFGQRGARAAVEALLWRDPEPRIPAALYAGGARTTVIGRDFLVSGYDRAGGVPALGVGDASEAAALQRQLSHAEADLLVGTGGSPSVVLVEPIDVSELVAWISESAASIRGPGPMELKVLPDAEVDSAVTGAGVLVAPRGLRVRRSLVFDGLLLVLGGLEFERGATVQINGSVWVEGSGTLVLEANGWLRYSSQILAAIDRQFAGLIPHRLSVTSRRQLF
jgi:hypothetical protein